VLFRSNGFDLVIPTPLYQFNMLPDSTFQIIADKIVRLNDVVDLAQYPFNLQPPTDNIPFFSQFLKIQRFADYFSWFGSEGVPFLELGYLIVWACLFICLVLALIAIAFPMIISLRRRNFVLTIWLYFAFLGLGYMLVEMALIQRSILVVGNPIMSSATIIAALLCFSAIGSFASSYLPLRKGLTIVLIGITLFILLFTIGGETIAAKLVGITFTYRIVLLVVIIAPLSLLMGMSFPLGMRYINDYCSDQIPIAWGVNGFFSVLAAPTATILAVEYGFSHVFALSAMLYFLCLPLGLLMIRKGGGVK